MKKFGVKSAHDLGPQFVHNQFEMIGQDGAYSIPLGDGLLFYFGDTLIGKRREGESLWYPDGKAVGPYDMSGKAGIVKMINNTGLICTDKSGELGLDQFNYILDAEGQIKNLIPLDEDEHPDWYRIWCLHGIKIREKIYLFFVKVHMLEDGVFPVNFEIEGSGMAVGTKEDWHFKRIIHEGSSVLWKKDQPVFSSAVVKDTTGEYLYLYGVLRDVAGVQQCYLARVKPEKIECLEHYEYYTNTSSRWSKTVSDAVPVMSGMPNELSVSFNEYLGCYLAVHSLDLTGQIVARTADSLWGPWSEPVKLWQVETERTIDLPYPVLIYAGKEHPGLADQNGKVIYITYVEFEEYYPHLIQIELE